MYGATILASIEREITHGEPLADYFDLIAGTSTGGIMALALGMKISTERIENLYLKDGKEIFKQSWWLRNRYIKLCFHIFKTLYNYEVLEHLLRREFGDAILGQASTRLVIPAFMVPKTEIAVFKTDHHPDFKRDWQSKVWEVARATSAAPTYLAGHESDSTLFLDGGVWANNPVMVAVIDALSAYDITREQIHILSIGTGNFPFNIATKGAKGGLFSWKEVIKAAMFLTTDNAHGQAALLLGPEQIKRLEPDETANGIDLDDWAEAVVVLPSMARKHFEAGKSELEQFCESKVAPRERFYTRYN